MTLSTEDHADRIADHLRDVLRDEIDVWTEYDAQDHTSVCVAIAEKTVLTIDLCGEPGESVHANLTETDEKMLMAATTAVQSGEATTTHLEGLDPVDDLAEITDFICRFNYR